MGHLSQNPAHKLFGRGTLRDAAAQSRLAIGVAVRPELFADSRYTRVVQQEFNFVQPENAMKWEVVRRNKDRFDFAAGDAVAAFARNHHLGLRGHALVWRLYNPSWLHQLGYGPHHMERLMRDHMERMMDRYAGTVFAWDVVNEALEEDGAVGSSIWYDSPGIGYAGQRTEYIERCFRWAREIDPTPLLFYNDSGFARGRKADAIHTMLCDFRERGVPVDGVGIQLHLKSGSSLEGFEEHLGRLAELGLQIHISELDVAVEIQPDGEPCADDLNRQSHLLGEVVRICRRSPSCTAIQMWGVCDGNSWVPLFSENSFGNALLFDCEYRVKPAYWAILDGLAGT
jgi:endo-1,4-beta-xylanase